MAAGAKIAVRETSAFLGKHPSIDRVVFALFDEAALKIYDAEIARSLVRAGRARK